MNGTTTTATGGGVDWTSIINNTINQMPYWLAVARNQPVAVNPPGGQGGSVVVTPSGIAGSITPGILIAGVIGIVALVYLLRR